MPLETLTWVQALARYRAALAAEHAYDQSHWSPAYYACRDAEDAAKAAGRPCTARMPADVEDYMEVLGNVRGDAEDALLATPAPSLAEFAIKYLICFDFGREFDVMQEALIAEARRLLGVSIDADATDLAGRLQTIEKGITQ